MNMAALAKAVYDRLTADTTLTGLATGGVFNRYGPETGQTTEANSPYVVFQVGPGDATTNTTFGSDGFIMTVTVLIACLRTAGYDTPSAMLERVFGNWSDANPQTFGLHRWQPTLSGTNWTAGQMACTSVTQDASDPDIALYYLEFTVPLSRTKP
jgi:hypothetical protein